MHNVRPGTYSCPGARRKCVVKGERFFLSHGSPFFANTATKKPVNNTIAKITVGINEYKNSINYFLSCYMKKVHTVLINLCQSI